MSSLEVFLMGATDSSSRHFTRLLLLPPELLTMKSSTVETGWVGFFWTVWLAMKKSMDLVKHSLSATGSAIYTVSRYSRWHQADGTWDWSHCMIVASIISGCIVIVCLDVGLISSFQVLVTPLYFLSVREVQDWQVHRCITYSDLSSLFFRFCRNYPLSTKGSLGSRGPHMCCVLGYSVHLSCKILGAHI